MAAAAVRRPRSRTTKGRHLGAGPVRFLVALATYSRKNPVQWRDLDLPAETAPQRPPRQHQQRLTPAQVEELAALRRSGSEINDLARHFGIHRSTVMNHLNRAAVPQRRRQGRTLNADQIKAAGRLYASGLSLIEVGERFNVDKRYLRRVLPEAGFTLRPPGRRPTA